MHVEGADEVAHLRLDHDDQRGVADAGVGAGQEEQVGEAGDRRAEVGLRAGVGPVLGEGAAVDGRGRGHRPGCR